MISTHWQQRVFALLISLLLLLPSSQPNIQTDSYTFSQTGQIVSGRFLDYWQQNGGLAQFGYPVSAAMQETSATDGKSYTVQYFERAVFELHPENQSPNEVLLSLLGSFRYRQMYPTGVAQMPSSETNARLFPETGKRVGGAFLDYWQQNGGLARQGLPITDEVMERSELDGKAYRVQYFERAVFELHPENAAPYRVLLTHLGASRYRAQYATAGRVVPIGSMTMPRSCHSATLLPNGKVLIAGGMVSDGVFTAGAELFDPTTTTYFATGSMAARRGCHTATLLTGGKVLITGGYGDGYLSGAELYDPANGKFTAVGSLNKRREAHTATLLPNGKVLIAGGYNGASEASVELYDPTTTSFTLPGNMSVARSAHTATLLPDGRVLLVGGSDGRDRDGRVLATAELYDPRTNRFATTGSLTVARYKHAAMSLAEGRVLVVGGGNDLRGRAYYASSEIYNPLTGTFSEVANMAVARFKFRDAVAALPNGRVLVSGGGAAVEVFNPTTASFSSAAGRLDEALSFATATLLPNGKVLIAGGYDQRIQPTAKSWLYEP